jgi:acetylornithine deacetylase/succinyl-diaminopimelate desuccinylase-like protein
LPASAELRAAIDELAQAQGVRECLRWFTREKQWVNERQLELCRIPAPTFLEQRRAEWMLEQFRAAGCVAEIDGPGNVVAQLEPSGPHRPLVALTAHLDTVLAPRHPEDISVEADGALRGPGVSDNGAGLAGLLAVARAMRSSPPIADARSDLLLVANVGEEGEGNLSGMRHLVGESRLGPRIRAFLVLEGAGTDRVVRQALASRRFEVSFTGPGGHSWSDSGAANPIHALARAIAIFAEHCGRLANGASDGVRSSFHFGVIEGGASVNAIPSLARGKVDLRSESDQRIEEMLGSLTAAVERAAEVENLRATGSKLAARIREIGSRPGGKLDENAPMLLLLRAVDAHLGIRARLECSSTDANIPLAAGLPALALGAGGRGGGAHTPAEWFQPEGRDLGLKRVLLMLALLLRE